LSCTAATQTAELSWPGFFANGGRTMVNEDIGKRLRHVRQVHGLSQRALAKKAGVVNSTISLIEAGRTNPSVGALKRILDAIPISLGEFFTLEPNRNAKTFFKRAELTQIGKGGISYLQIGEDLGGRAIQILRERYAPGTDTGRIPLTHDGEEGGFVLSGRLEVTVGDERQIISAGGAYYFESSRPHRFRCIGPEPCEVISACTPPTF